MKIVLESGPGANGQEGWKINVEGSPGEAEPSAQQIAALLAQLIVTVLTQTPREVPSSPQIAIASEIPLDAARPRVR